MAGVVKGGSDHTVKRAMRYCVVLFLLVGIVVVGPKMAFAESAAHKDFITEPGTILSFRVQGPFVSGFELYAGAPGKEKLIERRSPTSAPAPCEYRYFVPEGQYETRVKIVSSEALPNGESIAEESGIGSEDVRSAYSGEALEVTDSSATIHAASFDIRLKGGASVSGTKILYGKNSDFAEHLSSPALFADAVGSIGGFDAVLSNLEPGTTYYYQAACFVEVFSSSSEDSVRIEAYGEVRSFTTAAANDRSKTNDGNEISAEPVESADLIKPIEALSITTGYATSVSRSTAVITNAISLEHEPAKLESCGLEVGSDIALDNPLVFYASSRTDDSFTVDLEGLEEGTIYYYRCFYKTDQEFLYGKVRSFSTISRPL